MPRYVKRNSSHVTLVNLSGNKEFMEKFDNWLKGRKFDADGSISTISKATGHVGYYPDSFLYFMLSRDQSFRLNHLLDLKSDEFIQLPDPKDWVVHSGSKKHPTKQIEELKSFARLLDFIREYLEDINAVNDLELLTKKDHVIRRLQNLSDRVKDSDIMSKLKKMEKMERREVEKAKLTLNPDNYFNEQQAVRVWFDSEEAAAEESKFEDVWKRGCVEGRPVNGREFTYAAGYTRFMTCLDSKNRTAALEFSNKDFRERVDKWLPPSLEITDKLPDNWNMNEAPGPGIEPSCYVVEPSGKGMRVKKGEMEDVVLTKRSFDLCIKYQELKEKVIGESEDDDKFFVNNKNVPLAPMKRVVGSMLYKFGKVTGVTGFTSNSFRRATDTKIQGNPSLKPFVKQIQSHSNSVSLEYYDKSRSNVRAAVMSKMSEKESPYKGESSVSEELASDRSARRKIDLQKNVEVAKKVLLDRKLRKNVKLGKRCKVTPKARLFMQKLFSSPAAGEIFNATRNIFPGNFID